MKVSVIVSTYTENRLNDLMCCFKSLEEQTLSPYEVLLVLDPKQDLIKFYESRIPDFVRIVVSSEMGLSNARNAGVKESQGDIVAFIDDDAYAEDMWLEKLCENYYQKEVMGVGGLLQPYWENKQPSWLPVEFYWTIGCSFQELERKREVRNPIGANMSFRKEVFNQVGYFRTDIGRKGKTLLAGEEAEFSLNVLTEIKDSKIIYEPEAIVYHRVPHSRLSLRYLINRSYYEGISKGLISKKNTQKNSLSTEQNYLKHLIFRFIPSKIKTLYKRASFSQLVITIILMSSVFTGYLYSRFS